MTEIVLPALRADSVLGYLAALGVLRLTSVDLGDRSARLGWPDGPYAPAMLSTTASKDVDSLAEQLYKVFDQARARGQLVPGLDGFPPYTKAPSGSDLLGALSLQDVEAWMAGSFEEPRLAEWLPALVGVTAPDEDGKLPKSRFVAAGPGTVWVERTFANLLEPLTLEQVSRALTDWRRGGTIGAYLDSRADIDASRSPATKGAAEKYGEPGASLLGLMALPLFPVRTTPEAQTVGWTRSRRAGGQVFRYPVWSSPHTLAAVSVLVDHPAILGINWDEAVRPRQRRDISALGVEAVFESLRQMAGNYAAAMQPAVDLLFG